jgi:glycogen phosphorylase
MLRIHAMPGGTPGDFHEKWAVQLNDTHPTVAVAKLMRLLDEHGLGCRFPLRVWKLAAPAI